RRDQQREQRRPDPVAWIPPQLLTPSASQPRDEAACLDWQPETAFEAVLLVRLMRRPATRTERPPCGLCAVRLTDGRFAVLRRRGAHRLLLPAIGLRASFLGADPGRPDHGCVRLAL